MHTVLDISMNIPGRLSYFSGRSYSPTICSARVVQQPYDEQLNYPVVQPTIPISVTARSLIYPRDCVALSMDTCANDILVADKDGSTP